MIRVAVLADIHGNLPALEAVIEDIAAQQPDEVLVGGDLVGRGPCGKDVVQRVTDMGWRSVRGNHEDYLLAFRHKRVRSHWLTAPEWAAARWMAGELDEAAASTLEGLPLTLLSELAPELRLVHGTPRSNSEGIGPWTSHEQVEAHFSTVAEPVLVCGHTHRPRFPDPGDIPLFNDGSCVHPHSIIGIEIVDLKISLIKWYEHYNDKTQEKEIIKVILEGPTCLEKFL